MKKFKISDIKNPAYYQKHRTEIVQAYSEPGQPRIDFEDRPAGPDTSGLNMYQAPELGTSFTPEQIAAMSPAQYQENRTAILAAVRGENGAQITPRTPVERPKPVTLFESDRAFVESGGSRRELERKRFAERADSEQSKNDEQSELDRLKQSLGMKPWPQSHDAA